MKQWERFLRAIRYLKDCEEENGKVWPNRWKQSVDSAKEKAEALKPKKIEEAADYFGISQKKIRKIVDENPTAEFVLKNGAFTKIKRGKFEMFLDQTSSI